MTEKTMRLEIVSAEKELFGEEVRSFMVSGTDGEVGIFPGHTALLTQIKPGQIDIIDAEGKESIFYVSGGLLEVQPNIATVLSDISVEAEDLDEVVVQAAKERAESVLSEGRDKIDYTKALSELAEASAQLRAIQLLRRIKR